jgi:hypothetical protein
MSYDLNIDRFISTRFVARSGDLYSHRLHQGLLRKREIASRFGGEPYAGIGMDEPVFDHSMW